MIFRVHIHFFWVSLGFILKEMGKNFLSLFDHLSKDESASTIILETVKDVCKKVGVHFFENNFFYGHLGASISQ